MPPAVRVLTNNFLLFGFVNFFNTPLHTCQSPIHILIAMSPIDSPKCWACYDSNWKEHTIISTPFHILLVLLPNASFFAYVFGRQTERDRGRRRVRPCKRQNISTFIVSRNLKHGIFRIFQIYRVIIVLWKFCENVKKLIAKLKLHF